MKNLFIIIGLSILSIVLGYVVFSQRQSIKSLERSNSIQENQLNNLRDDNFVLIDSLNYIGEDYRGQEKRQEEKIKSQLKKIDSIIKSIPDEKDVDHINDSDSLYLIFTKYYPDNTRTSQGRD